MSSPSASKLSGQALALTSGKPIGKPSGKQSGKPPSSIVRKSGLAASLSQVRAKEAAAAAAAAVSGTPDADTSATTAVDLSTKSASAKKAASGTPDASIKSDADTSSTTPASGDTDADKSTTPASGDTDADKSTKSASGTPKGSSSEPKTPNPDPKSDVSSENKKGLFRTALETIIESIISELTIITETVDKNPDYTPFITNAMKSRLGVSVRGLLAKVAKPAEKGGVPETEGGKGGTAAGKGGVPGTAAGKGGVPVTEAGKGAGSGGTPVPGAPSSVESEEEEDPDKHLPPTWRTKQSTPVKPSGQGPSTQQLSSSLQGYAKPPSILKGSRGQRSRGGSQDSTHKAPPLRRSRKKSVITPE